MSLIQSDKSIAGDLQKAKITARRKGFRDLDLSLIVNPRTKDIVPLRDDVAIKNAVRNLLTTNFYERPFGHSKGANLRGLLFEPADNITIIEIKQNIQDVLQKHEPRVSIQSIVVKDLSDRNAYNIILQYRIKEFDSLQEVEIVLRRLR
jgi:phage baseplate assembly protein W